MGTTDILVKSGKGEAEIASTTASISLKHRCLLVMIDGNLSEEDYIRQVRTLGEVQVLLRDLEEKGYIERRKRGPVPLQSVEDHSMEMLNIEARKYMTDFMYSIMGPGGETMALRLERCKSNKDLADMLGVCRETLAGMGKQEMVREFEQKVKALLA